MSDLEGRVDIESGELVISLAAGANVPPKYPLVITKGGDWRLLATWMPQSSTPELLSGASATFTIYDAPGGTALVSLSGGSGITLADTRPTITVAISAATLNAYTWGPRAVYRLAVTVSGTTTVILTGPVVLRAG